MPERKCINIKEFRELGYLQEVNRRFLHPLGLALEVIIEEDGSERLGDVWDSRDDPEGFLFADCEAQKLKEKAEYVQKEWNKRFKVRMEKFGRMVQKAGIDLQVSIDTPLPRYYINGIPSEPLPEEK